jgi:hypothetical protein
LDVGPNPLYSYRIVKRVISFDCVLTQLVGHILVIKRNIARGGLGRYVPVASLLGASYGRCPFIEPIAYVIFLVASGVGYPNFDPLNKNMFCRL